MITKTKEKENSKQEKKGKNKMAVSEVKAVAKYVRISAKKLRPIANIVRGKPALQSMGILNNVQKSGAILIKTVLQSAIANAEHNNKCSKEGLYISQIFIDEGTHFKRHQPRARGRGFAILKKTSHITIVLKEVEGAK